MIVMRKDAEPADVQYIVDKLAEAGAEGHVSSGDVVTVIGVIGDREVISVLPLEAYPGVDKVLPIVTEVMDVRHLAEVAEVADVLQVGARNMHNFHLLSAVGEVGLPVLLKRGMSATIDEFLMAAEYIVKEGNDQVILCERGIRTFETATRNTLDIAAIPVIKHLSHLPIIVDPSHAAGKVDLVEPLSLAAVAAGADGLLIEAHPTPESALVDGGQSLNPEQFRHTAGKIADLVRWTGKVMA